MADSDHTRWKDAPPLPVLCRPCGALGYNWLRDPPLKRWAIVGRPYGAAAQITIAREGDKGALVDRPCEADGADARGLRQRPKSGGRQTHAARKKRIHAFLRGGSPSPEDDRQ